MTCVFCTALISLSPVGCDRTERWKPEQRNQVSLPGKAAQNLFILGKRSTGKVCDTADNKDV